MHYRYGLTYTSSCCLSSFVLSAAVSWGEFFLRCRMTVTSTHGDIVIGTWGEKVSNLIMVTEKQRACVYVCYSIWLYRVEIFRLTQLRLHYLTTGRTTGTMIVVAVCCRIVVLYSQETRCCCCYFYFWLFLSRGKSVVTWNQPRNYSSSSGPGFFKWAYCVWDHFCVLEKEKRSDEVCKICWKNSLHDYKLYQLHIKGHGTDCQLLL